MQIDLKARIASSFTGFFIPKENQKNQALAKLPTSS